MGQCFGLQGRTAASRSNKGFDYAPRRSWKHNDAHVMTQFKALSLESEEEEEQDGRRQPTRTRAISSDSEDDVYTSQPRRSGHLVFSEEGEEEEEEEEELDDDEDDHSPHRLTLINKGFKLLPDSSPTLSSSKDDTIQLIKDTDDHVT